MATNLESSLTKGRQQPIRMYHVTDVQVVDHAGVKPKPPTWEEVRVNVADDEYYDGELFGLPVACFTTTLRNGKLPSSSPYPRQLKGGEEIKQGTQYWRVACSFDPSKFEIFKMKNKNVTNQIHLLCLNKNPQDDSKEELLAKIMPPSAKLSQHDLNEYFPGNKANDYKNDGQEFFVNVCFIKPVPIHDGKWTIVTKELSSREKLQSEHTELSNKRRLKRWGENQLQSSQIECKQLLTSLLEMYEKSLQLQRSVPDYDAARRKMKQIEYFMQNGIEALQKQWKYLFDQEAEHTSKSDVQVAKLTKDLSSVETS